MNRYCLDICKTCNRRFFYSGKLTAGIIDLQRFHPHGKYYRVRGSKRVNKTPDRYYIFYTIFLQSYPLEAVEMKIKTMFWDYFLSMNINGVRLQKWYIHMGSKDVLPSLHNMR